MLGSKEVYSTLVFVATGDPSSPFSSCKFSRLEEIKRLFRAKVFAGHCHNYLKVTTPVR